MTEVSKCNKALITKEDVLKLSKSLRKLVQMEDCLHDRTHLVNTHLAPVIEHLLQPGNQDDQLEFVCLEAARNNAAEINYRQLEPIMLALMGLPEKREFCQDLSEILHPQVVRQWRVLSCEFRHTYR